MPSFRFALSLAAVLAASLFGAAPASAHIAMRWPTPRLSDGTLSQGPCAQRHNGRLADGVTELSPGQSIDVVWDVYVQHVSYFRIAFDADGDDSLGSRASLPVDPATDDPTLLPANDGATILAYVEDRTGNIDHVEQRVTLPNVTCDNCTLQVTQFTYGLPLESATYYQCADIVLSGPLLPAGDPAVAVDGGPPPRREANAAGGTLSSDGGPEGSCAFALPRRASGWAWPVVGSALGLAAARRRSRKRELGSARAE